MSKTIIVSNRLPIKIEYKDGVPAYQTSEGGLATGLGSVYKAGNNIWLGWPGIASNPDDDVSQIVTDLKEKNMHPVFLTPSEVEDFYEGFSNETLWPNFHYFNQYTIYDDNLWKAYQDVNVKYCLELEKIISEGDTIWIHDYQLMLLPQLIREKHPDVAIGFFLHIPFPSYESFRRLPWRQEILNGLLGADFVGFHTYDDMRHFLSSVSRLVGFGNDNGMIKTEDRLVMSDALPMGIDYEKYESLSKAKDTLEREKRYRKTFGKEQIMLSIDRLDYSKGIAERLRAFETFLTKYPDFQGKVSLLMIVVPSRDTVPKYRQLKEEVDLLVGQINGKFSRMSWNPIHYFYRSFPPNALSAFYRMADVALITPIRDGMNLVCKEFIASKTDKKGVLILSEMAGSSKELSDAILINPTDQNQLVESIHTALTMPPDEQIHHMEIMQKTVRRYNIHHWVDLFMNRLQHVKELQQNLETKSMEIGIYRKLLSEYDSAKSRMLFLDYDGTLKGFTDDPSKAQPDEELKRTLDKLIEQKGTSVTIISGRDRNTLENWFGHLPIYLVAEHGAWTRTPKGEFKSNVKLESDWKDQIMDVMDQYVGRTPGSFIEEKDYSVVWHYRKVETGLGEIRTRELMSHLNYITHNKNLVVMDGNKVLEVKPNMVNKGIAAQSLMSQIECEFVMACGDDFTDENMFSALPDAWSIKVGGGSSAAKYRVNTHTEIRKLLEKLSES